MAFQLTDLSVLAYANGFTQWHYRTDDRTVGPGYFDEASDMVRPGDFIFVNSDAGGVPAGSILGVWAVAENSVSFSPLQCACPTCRQSREEA